MSSDLYSNRVLELAADIPNVGRLEIADGRARRVSRLCGSIVELDLTLDGETIASFAIEPKACALGQASASILSRSIIGASASEVRLARDGFAAMLKQGKPPPSGRFWELRHLAGVADYPARHTSALLAFDAAVEAIEQALAQPLLDASAADQPGDSLQEENGRDGVQSRLSDAMDAA